MNFEEYKLLKSKIHKLLLDSSIPQSLSVSDKLVDAIEDHLLTKIQFKEFYNNTLAYYFLGYHIGLIRSFLIKFFRLRHIGDETALEKDLVFVSARTLYNRFLKLSNAIDNSSVIYLPDINYEYLDKQLCEHKKIGNCVYAFAYNLNDIVKVCASNIKLLPKIFKLMRLTKEVDGLSEFKIANMVLMFCMKFVSGSMTINKKITKAKVIISDYDKSIDMLILCHYREKNALNFKIGSLNHGAFYGFNLSYVRPCADFIMCTSRRELELTKKYSLDQFTNIHAVGAPMQSFVDNYQSITAATESKGYLVLGTFVEGEWKENQKKLIRYIKSMGLEFKYRLRPASMDHDLRELSDVLNLDDCTCNTTLSEDCDRFQNIITFSFDALNSCIRKTRNILIYVPQKVYDNYSPLGEDSDQIIITPVWNDVKSFLDKKHEESKYNEKTKQWITDNVGEQDFDKVVENIKKVINHYL